MHYSWQQLFLITKLHQIWFIETGRTVIPTFDPCHFHFTVLIRSVTWEQNTCSYYRNNWLGLVHFRSDLSVIRVSKWTGFLITETISRCASKQCYGRHNIKETFLKNPSSWLFSIQPKISGLSVCCRQQINLIKITSDQKKDNLSG